MIQGKSSHSSTICFRLLLFLKAWKWVWAAVNVSAFTAWCNTTAGVSVAFCPSDTHCHNMRGRWRQLTALTITASVSEAGRDWLQDAQRWTIGVKVPHSADDEKLPEQSVVMWHWCTTFSLRRRETAEEVPQTWRIYCTHYRGTV